MTYDPSIRGSKLPAPCFVDVGTIINKQDMRRILSNLGAVRYAYLEQERCLEEGDGYVVEVFSDPHQATLVANHTLYLNVYSFDYIELHRSQSAAYFDLIQDSRRLRLIPLSNPLHEPADHAMELATLDAMMSDVISRDIDGEESDLL